jgi:hypothetical protein
VRFPTITMHTVLRPVELFFVVFCLNSLLALAITVALLR